VDRKRKRGHTLWNEWLKQVLLQLRGLRAYDKNEITEERGERTKEGDERGCKEVSALLR
jgi:hypothetical protein